MALLIQRNQWRVQPPAGTLFDLSHPLLRNAMATYSWGGDAVNQGNSGGSYSVYFGAGWSKTGTFPSQTVIGSGIAGSGIGYLHNASNYRQINIPTALSNPQFWTIATVVYPIATPGAGDFTGFAAAAGSTTNDRHLNVGASFYTASLYDTVTKTAISGAAPVVGKLSTVIGSTNGSTLNCWSDNTKGTVAVSNGGYNGYVNPVFNIGDSSQSPATNMAIVLMILSAVYWTDADAYSFMANPWQVFVPTAPSGRKWVSTVAVSSDQNERQFTVAPQAPVSLDAPSRASIWPGSATYPAPVLSTDNPWRYLIQPPQMPFALDAPNRASVWPGSSTFPAQILSTDNPWRYLVVPPQSIAQADVPRTYTWEGAADYPPGVFNTILLRAPFYVSDQVPGPVGVQLYKSSGGILVLDGGSQQPPGILPTEPTISNAYYVIAVFTPNADGSYQGIPVWCVCTNVWQRLTSYAANSFVIPNANANGHFYKVISAAGTSGSSEPSPWPTGGGTTTDGSLTWQDQGQAFFDGDLVFIPSPSPWLVTNSIGWFNATDPGSYPGTSTIQQYDQTGTKLIRTTVVNFDANKFPINRSTS